MTSDKGTKLAQAGQNPSSTETTNKKSQVNPKLDTTSQKRIGDQLRAMYDELMQQPVPDRFRDLLDQLDKAQPSPKAPPEKDSPEGSK